MKKGTSNVGSWISQIFDADAANTGGMVRRAVADVIKYGSIDALVAEVKARHFNLIRFGDQFVIFCGCDPVEVIATNGFVVAYPNT